MFRPIVKKSTKSVSAECCRTHVKDRSYERSTHWNTLSLPRNTGPWSSSRMCFRSLEHIIGVVVSEMARDTRIATESVTANSRNNRPTIPPIIRIGMKTATSEMLIESTVNPISLAPFNAASIGRIPASR